MQADVTRFALRPTSLDAVLMLYVLGHVPGRAHQGLIKDVAAWLKPGGMMLANAPPRPFDQINEAWLGTRMYFGGIARQETEAALNLAGLVVEDLASVSEPEGDETSVEFLWFTATKPD